MTSYNGHRSWNAWNVSLWINNDPYLYELAKDCVACASNVHAAARMFRQIVGKRTPDKARFNQLCVRLVLEEFYETRSCVV